MDRDVPKVTGILLIRGEFGLEWCVDAVVLNAQHFRSDVRPDFA